MECYSYWNETIHTTCCVVHCDDPFMPYGQNLTGCDDIQIEIEVEK